MSDKKIRIKTFMNPIAKSCKTCGIPFEISPKQQQSFADKSLALPENCISCREKKRIIEYSTCKDCGDQFGINQLEKEWYEKKGMHLPNRCLGCRRKRREEKAKP
jgi:hypothetical protein